MGRPHHVIPIGTRFNQWTVVEGPIVGNEHGAEYICECSCGHRQTWYGYKLRHPKEVTECCRDCFLKSQHHGPTEHPRLYRIWNNMKSRCSYQEHYINNGISIIAEWLMFDPFRDWSLANGYADHLEIDRRDNALGYSPDNCRWVDHRTNMNNRSNTIHLTAFGETKCLSDWLEDPRCIHGRSTIRQRLKLNWPHEDCLTKPSTRVR